VLLKLVIDSFNTAYPSILRRRTLAWHIESPFSGNYPFKLTFTPLDATSLALPIDVPRVLVGLEMVDCRAIEAS
jgi:hypothetical protein